MVAVSALAACYAVRAVAFGEGFGVGGLVRAFTTRLKVTPTPLLPAHTEVVVITSTTTRGLRHSAIYANPHTLDEIVRWLNLDAVNPGPTRSAPVARG